MRDVVEWANSVAAVVEVMVSLDHGARGTWFVAEGQTAVVPKEAYALSRPGTVSAFRGTAGTRDAYDGKLRARSLNIRAWGGSCGCAAECRGRTPSGLSAEDSASAQAARRATPP
ncbi:hypothetical protein GCM10022284_63820 [Streptomyces hundungensis]